MFSIIMESFPKWNAFRIMKVKEFHKMQSLERVLGLISLIEASEKGESTLAELTKESGLPPSTIHRIINVLIKHRYIYQDKETRSYRLGSRLVELGLKARDSLDVRRLALPIMETLTTETNETSYLTIRNGYYGVYIEKVESNQNLRLFEPLGAVVPLHLGASRKVLLAYLPDSTVDEMYVRGFLKSKTAETTVDPEELKEQLKTIRQNGVAVSFGENIENAAAVAAPVWDSEGNVIASLSIAGPAARLSTDRVNELTKIIKKSADEISIGMGWTGDNNKISPEVKQEKN